MQNEPKQNNLGLPLLMIIRGEVATPQMLKLICDEVFSSRSEKSSELQWMMMEWIMKLNAKPKSTNINSVNCDILS